MTVDYESRELDLRLWRQLYQTYTLLKLCEDQIFGEHGLTTEQYGVLVSLSYLGEPARVTDIARWLERSTNSISMIVDRMVKAGLITRRRDTRDRRVVYVSSTSKARSLFTPANVESLQNIVKIFSPMSPERRLSLLNLLGEVKYETLKCLNPGVDIEKVKKAELKQAVNVKEWLKKYGLPSTPQTKRPSGGKRKTIRRG
jgi:DNA-binding MarR family transcriptional regulator